VTRESRAILAGILATAVSLGAVVWVNAKDVAGRREDLQRETQVSTRLIATRVHAGLQKHLTALRQMANFYASSRKVTEKAFSSFADTTLKMNPACLNVAYVDPAFRVRRVYPAGGGPSLVGLDVSGNRMGYETITRARQIRGPVLSPPLQLIRGPQGFVLAVPIFAAREFLGTLLGACRSSEYFTSMLLPEVSERYEQMVLDAGEPIFASEDFDPHATALPAATEQFMLGDASWEIRLQAKSEVVEARLASRRVTTWAMGLLFAFASGALAYVGTLWVAGITAELASRSAALRETRDRLEGTRGQLIQAEKMTAIGELVAGVAHEINNPLTGIVGYTQLLMQGSLEAGVRRKIETIAAEAERMAKIVRNLLTFARKHAPEKVLVSLNTVVDRTLELKAYNLRASQIRLETDLDPALPATLLDFHQMQQVLVNLLNNAQQAMASARSGGTIRLATRCVDDVIELRLSDDGPGIPEEVQGRIFEPFFTTKKDGEGTGLGLSLCYGIVQEHSGTIRVESGAGAGAAFVIELPILQAGAVPAPRARRDPKRAVPSLSILVVDDEPSVQSFLVELLSQRGHTVETASDVPDALERLDAGRHDLVITDMKMPHGTGMDVYRAAVSRNPKLAGRILFMTGHATGDDTQRFMHEVGGEPLQKPCRIEEIDRAIAAALRN